MGGREGGREGGEEGGGQGAGCRFYGFPRSEYLFRDALSAAAARLLLQHFFIQLEITEEQNPTCSGDEM